MEKAIKIQTKKAALASPQSPPPTKLRIIGKNGRVINTIQVDTPRTYFLKKTLATEKGHASAETNLVFEEVRPLFDFLEYKQSDVAEVLEVNSSTLTRWKRKDNAVSIGLLRSKAMLDIDHVIAKGIRIFATEENFKTWLNTSNYALGDKKPIELLKNPYEIEVIDNTLEAMSWGNFV